jgi:hypothetical protein
MTPELRDRVVNRLVDTGVSNEEWAFVILAALEGPAELDGYLDGESAKPELPATATSAAKAPSEPPGVYVTSLTVEGFRGIGSPVKLTFPPGPGLTLVVGRNGTGKSSVAEGLELLLTDSNYRWADRPKVWQEGWRNLHQHQRVRLEAELLVEGQGVLTATREWNSGRLDENESAIKRAGQLIDSLESDVWRDPFVTFRPFLSYNELGSLLEEGPAKLHDALSRVLGLEELVPVQAMLASARKVRETRVLEAKTRAQEILDAIAALGPDARDSRLEAAANASRWPRVDLKRLEDLIANLESPDRTELLLLERLRGLPQPDVDGILQAADALESAARALKKFAGTSIERARERAELLQEAVDYHDKHKDTACPVCARPDALSPSWRDKTMREIETLLEEARAFDAAKRVLDERMRDAQRFITTPHPVLAQSVHLGLPSLAEARRQWATWATGRDLKSPGELVTHLRTHVQAFADAISALVDEATAEWKRRQDVWQPIAAKIAEFLPIARAGLKALPRIPQLKSAESWWKEASGEIRDERFAPVADRAIATWKQLRLRSNVDLGGIDLEGAAQRRKVTLRVTVDGTPAQALGVMSQGELHALALSLFLPRATLPESPFRFVWIDDPVQSMDPARVFTHDDRLPEATRRLGIPATMFSLTRRAKSLVEVTTAGDPVNGHLSDARAVALTRELPPKVAARVVPGFCRAALEAACMEVVRRRRLSRGELHDVVENLLTTNAKPHPLMALALFDDENRTGDVLARLNKTDRAFGDVLQACKAGSHVEHDGDLGDLIARTDRLAGWILKECS